MNRFHLVRAPTRLDELTRWSGRQRWARHGGATVRMDRGRALHHLLTEVFGRRVLSPFRLMVPSRRQSGILYAYSESDGEALREAAANFAGPEHLAVLDAARIAVKTMPGKWHEGQRLGFQVQARPVRRISGPIPTRKGTWVGQKPGARSTELDVFWLAKMRNPQAELNRQDVYLDWLDEQLRESAKLDKPGSRLVRFRRLRVARGNAAVDGPHAVLEGTLTVEDPAAFAILLRRGIGRHRAYGYGMLLLRPPQCAPLRS